MSIVKELNKWAMLRDALNKPYGFGLLQDSAKVIRTLQANKLSVDDLLWFVDETKSMLKHGTYQRVVEQAIQDSYRLHKDLSRVHACPSCDAPMYEFTVNTTPCNQVGGKYKVQWICPKCDTEEFE
jgi:RNase P subunit RPR2